MYTYDTNMNKQRSIRMQFLILIISSSDREISVSVSFSAEISVSVWVSVSVWFKLSVSAEILVQNATENRNTALIFCFDLGTFS